MKKNISIIFLFSIFSITAQNWKPFNDSTFQLFEEISSTFPKKVELMYFNFIQENIIPFQYSSQLTNEDEDFDHYSGASLCTTASYLTKVNSSWFGDKIESNSSDVNYILKNQDTLHFDFNTNVGDTLWIMNSNEKIFGICTLFHEENVIGLIDSVKYFNVHHTDLIGNPIQTSVIHNFQLILGKTIGFYTFFTRTNEYPNGKTYRLIGDKTNDLGKYSFKASDVYKLPIGSIVQHKETAPYLIRYTTYEVLGINSTTTSFTINYHKTIFNHAFNLNTGLYEDDNTDIPSVFCQFYRGRIFDY